MTKKEVDEIILKWALDNARKHEGKANPGAVIGKILSESPELKSRLKEISPKVQEIVAEVNSLNIDLQIEKLQDIAPELLEEMRVIRKRDVALIVLVDNEGRIILQLRDEKAPRFPGYWGFFGGGIKPNETPVEAVKREIKEELSINLRDPKLVFKLNYKNDLSYGTKFYFVEHWSDKTKLIQKEGKDMNWFFLDEIKNLKIAKHNKMVFEELKKVLNKD